nr:hypothetical protein FRC0402_01499 [Corynebacterium diphtheriae]
MKKTVILLLAQKDRWKPFFIVKDLVWADSYGGRKPRGQRVYPATNKNKIHAVLDKFEADKLGQKHSQSAKAGAMCGTTSFRSRKSN